MSDYNLAGVSPISKKCTGTVAQYAAVMMDGSTEGQVVVTTAITSRCLGAAMQSGTAGKMIPVQSAGEAKMIAGAAITAGAEVMPSGAGGAADGKVITATGATANSIGVAMTAAGADGDVITVRLMLSAKGPANT